MKQAFNSSRLYLHLVVLFLLAVSILNASSIERKTDKEGGEGKKTPVKFVKETFPTPVKMLLISFDGFRWDYMHKHNLTNFNRIRTQGSHAEYIYNSFATITFPNHWTIATGMYEESHGIVQNEIFDPVLNKTFNFKDNNTSTKEWFGQNKELEPIWATNQRAGKGRRSIAEWVGANVVFNTQHIENIPYNYSKPYRVLIDEFVDAFARKDSPVNFGALYFDEPDHTGHLYGPYSQQMEDKLQEIDLDFGYLLDELEKFGLMKDLNMIVTSDHGMDTIGKNTTIFLDQHVDTSLFNAFGSRAVYSLFVKNKTNIDTVYNQLKKLDQIDTFKKHEIPPSLYYKVNVRIGDIVIVSHVGHATYIETKEIDWTVNGGDHGYYNNISSMHPFFMAHGPDFKKNYKIAPFNNVDIYPLMCHILGLDAAANNGTLANVREMVHTETSQIRYKVLLWTGVALLGIVCAVLVNVVVVKIRMMRAANQPYDQL